MNKPVFRLSFVCASLLLCSAMSAPLMAQNLEQPVKICQVMQMERPEVFKIDVTEPKKPAAIDPVPILIMVDETVKLKAVLVCVHGLGLHKENYQELGERIGKKGYGVYAMDVRGFGEFQNLEGVQERNCNFQKCLDDVCEALKLARSLHPGVPVFVLGESMGGAIAMRVTEEHPELMDGLISSVPGAKRWHATKSALQVGLKLVTGGKSVNVGKGVVADSTSNEELKERWSNDKMARLSLSPMELIQFQNFMNANEKNADKIKDKPVLMVQGAEDRLVRQDDNEAILNRIGSADKCLVFVKGGEHLIFEEGQFTDDAINLLCRWIDDHSKGSTALSSVEKP